MCTAISIQHMYIWCDVVQDLLASVVSTGFPPTNEEIEDEVGRQSNAKVLRAGSYSVIPTVPHLLQLLKFASWGLQCFRKGCPLLQSCTHSLWHEQWSGRRSDNFCQLPCGGSWSWKLCWINAQLQCAVVPIVSEPISTRCRSHGHKYSTLCNTAAFAANNHAQCVVVSCVSKVHEHPTPPHPDQLKIA